MIDFLRFSGDGTEGVPFPLTTETHSGERL